MKPKVTKSKCTKPKVMKSNKAMKLKVMKPINKTSKLKNTAKSNDESLWKSFGEKFIGHNSDKMFVGYVGLGRKAMTISTPIEFFELFMTDNILEEIFIETNQYYRQQTATKPPGNGKMKKWEDTRKQEIKTMFGIMIWVLLTYLS